MADIKIQARNKFVSKLNNKIDKLNEDLKLLIQVDEALNIQSGGGLIQDALAQLQAASPNVKINPVGSVNVDLTAITAEATRLSKQLTDKVKILEDTLGLLLKHIMSTQHTKNFDLSSLTPQPDVSSLDVVSQKINDLDNKLDLGVLKTYNELFNKYSKLQKFTANESNELSREASAAGLTQQTISLLQKSIENERQKIKPTSTSSDKQPTSTQLNGSPQAKPTNINTGAKPGATPQGAKPGAKPSSSPQGAKKQGK